MEVGFLQRLLVLFGVDPLFVFKVLFGFLEGLRDIIREDRDTVGVIIPPAVGWAENLTHLDVITHLADLLMETIEVFVLGCLHHLVDGVNIFAEDTEGCVAYVPVWGGKCERDGIPIAHWEHHRELNLCGVESGHPGLGWLLVGLVENCL